MPLVRLFTPSTLPNLTEWKPSLATGENQAKLQASITPCGCTAFTERVRQCCSYHDICPVGINRFVSRQEKAARCNGNGAPANEHV